MGVFDRKGLEAYLQIPEDQELMALSPSAIPMSPRRSQAQGDLPPSQLSMNKMGKEDLSVRQVLSFSVQRRAQFRDLPKKRSRYKNRLMKSRYN